jgi:uncharacterized protein YbjT (DUF2867 family)
MRIAIVGGTGLVGRSAVHAVGRAGHEAVVVARSRGVDVTTGEGLDDTLAGVDAVVDVTNSTATDATVTREFFGTVTQRLLAAEERAGVGHHVVLSIVGLDRVEGNAHYAGKRRQEELVRAGSVPWTIVRATQFHDFAAMVAGWTRRGDAAVVPPLLVQPVAVSDVAQVLAEVAAGPPRGRVLEVAGPEPQDLVDMARRTLAARGDAVRLVPSWQAGPFGTEMAGEVLLPGPDAQLGPTTFDSWLVEQEATS